MSDEIETPYDSPVGVFDHLSFPSLRVAYLRGVSDAERLGVVAMQMGLTEETLVAAARQYHLVNPRLDYLKERLTRTLAREVDATLTGLL